MFLVREFRFYNGARSLKIYSVNIDGETKKRIRHLIFEHYFYTGWNEEEKWQRREEKIYERATSILYNLRIAKDYIDSHDPLLKELAELRLSYPKEYFQTC